MTVSTAAAHSKLFHCLALVGEFNKVALRTMELKESRLACISA
jgi:hypothetical protein